MFNLWVCQLVERRHKKKLENAPRESDSYTNGMDNYLVFTVTLLLQAQVAAYPTVLLHN